MQRLPSIEALVPSLYLKGISTGYMQKVLEAILGESAKDLSTNNMKRNTPNIVSVSKKTRSVCLPFMNFQQCIGSI
jgi:transposase-like protein